MQQPPPSRYVTGVLQNIRRDVVERDDCAVDASDVLAATSRSMIVTDALDPNNPITFTNAAFTRLFGYTKAEVIGSNCRFLQGPDTDPAVVAEISAAIEEGVSIRRQLVNYRKDGTSFWNDLVIDPIRDSSGRVMGFVSSQVEASELDVDIERRVTAATRLSSIASHVPGYIYQRVMDTDGNITLAYCSPSLNRMLGTERMDIAKSFHDFVHPDDIAALTASIRRSAATMSIFTEEFRLVSPSGTVHWLRSEAPPRLMDNGEIVWDGLAVEISAEKRWQNEITELALRDPLTGMPSRETWRQALAVHLAAKTRERRRCGLLCFDVAAFRNLNKSLGEHVGDDVLIEVGRRITAIATSVNGVAARIGGDEFAVLFPGCSSDRTLTMLLRAADEALALPMSIGGRTLTVRTCIGAALHSGGRNRDQSDGDIAKELMTQAEIALGWAKQHHCNDWHVYSTARDDRFRKQAILGKSLESAIDNEELELHYQPLVDLGSGQMLSAEALVRWNHPTLGLQRPDSFIPLAEKSGLITKLGRWVFRHALQQRRLWQEAGLAVPRIAVNVSGIQLIDSAFTSFVSDLLKKEGASANDFEIELTEGELIESSPPVMAALHALRAMGFTITIDDFGSGHATFRYLRDFPVDKLKIDQLFVRRLVLGSNDALIIRAVITLARSMGIGFVAEGIETEMQRDLLLREGCKIGQGYLFSPPLTADEFSRTLSVVPTRRSRKA